MEETRRGVWTPRGTPEPEPRSTWSCCLEGSADPQPQGTVRGPRSFPRGRVRKHNRQNKQVATRVFESAKRSGAQSTWAEQRRGIWGAAVRGDFVRLTC